MASLPYPRCQILYSVNSVGEQRTLSICVNLCHPWEKRYSRRTHTRNLLAEKSLPQMSTDVHRLGGYGIPAIPTLPNSVFCEFCGRTAHSKHLCKSVPSVGEKIFPQNAHTEPSGREEPPTDEHGCSQIRRVWHPCYTHAAKFCVFCEFCGRTAHPNHLWEVLSAIGFRVFGVFCGRSTLFKFVVKNFAPTP